MESLYNLIQSLKSSEYQSIKKCYKDEGKISENKSLFLLELLRNSNMLPDREICMIKLYKKNDEIAFRKLKSRLKNKILDYLLLENNLERCEEIDGLELMSIKLRKKLVQVTYIYLTKGNLSIVYDLLDEVIVSGEVYSMYSVVIEALQFKKSFIALRGKEKEIEDVNERIEYIKKCDSVSRQAHNYYSQLVRKIDFKASDNQREIQSHLLDAINDLKTELENKEIPTVSYYLKLLEIAYFSNEQEYEIAKECCLELFPLLKSKPLYKKERIGIAYDNLGHLDVFLENYNEAIDSFTTAQNFFKKNSINLTVSKEQEFLACFYASEFDMAEEALNFIIDNMQMDQGNFRSAKYSFYKAWLLFQNRKFKEAYNIANINLEISEDKGGWDIWARVLSIMCNIELKEFDKASLQTQSLKKHIERTGKNEPLKERDRIVFKCLNVIEKYGFLFSSIPSSELVFSNELITGNKSCWKPFTPELFPFNSWLSQKVNLTTEKKLKAVGRRS